MHTIFYFTGTGNCLQVSKKLAEVFPEEVRLIRVSAATLSLAKAEVYSGRVGIVYPSYSNNMPIMLKNFLEELTVDTSPETYIYTVLVHGGMPGRVHVYLKSIFARKGANVSGEFSVRMPHNGIVLFDAEPVEKQKIWFSGLDARVQEIADAIMAETVVTASETRPGLKAIKKIGLDLSKMPKPSDEQVAPNPLFDPYAREKLFYVTDACIGCGTCKSVCPAANISLSEGYPKWLGHCESCMACIQWCPAEAIECGEATVGRTRYRNPNVAIDELEI